MTEFLKSLSPIDPAHPATRACEEYLRVAKRIKGIADRRLGYIEDEPGVRMYYYWMGDGILEFESKQRGDDIWSRRVTDFIDDPAECQEMLVAVGEVAQAAKITPEDPTKVLFRAAR